MQLDYTGCVIFSGTSKHGAESELISDRLSVIHLDDSVKEENHGYCSHNINVVAIFFV